MGKTSHHPGGPRVEVARHPGAAEGTRRTPYREGADRVGPETDSTTYLARRDVAGT